MSSKAERSFFLFFTRRSKRAVRGDELLLRQENLCNRKFNCASPGTNDDENSDDIGQLTALDDDNTDGKDTKKKRGKTGRDGVIAAGTIYRLNRLLKSTKRC